MYNFKFKNELYFIEGDINKSPVQNQENPLISAQFNTEPLVNNRFIVRFPDWLEIYPWQISSCSGPACYNGGNVYRWEPLKIELYRFNSDILSRLIRRFSDPIPHFNLYIDLLGPDGGINETWEITHASILGLELDDLNDSNDDISKVKIEIQYSNVIILD